MDFFEAQTQAKKRTGYLVFLFLLAVLGTILATYGAALLVQALARYKDMIAPHTGGWGDLLWQPRMFGIVTTVTIAVVTIASLAKWSSFRGGGSVVAMQLGGRRVPSRTKNPAERQLLNVVEEMAIASGTPVPATFVLSDDESINAFAAGLTTHDAVVAVTQGTLDSLNRDELQAVIGHEFSHILNGDMRLNFRIASVLFGILVIGLAGRAMFSPLRHVGGSGRSRTRGTIWVSGRSRSSGNKKGGGGGGILLLYFAIAGALMAIGYIGYFFGRLVQAAVSRQREFLADASAVQFTRNPIGLTGALKKIGGQTVSPELESPRAGQINHCFFSQAFVSKFGGSFATHPPLPIRIRAIDPNFDGKFIAPVPRKESKPAPESPEPDKGKGSAIGLPPLIPGNGKVAIDPTTLLGTVGVLSAEGTHHAHQLLNEIGDSLREAARDPVEAEPLVYSLLMLADEAARTRQLLEIPAEQREAASGFFDKVKAHPITVRVPLAQLALGGLRKLDVPSQKRLIDVLQKLAASDGVITPFEYALHRIVRHDLLTAGRPTVQGGMQIHSFGALSKPISVLLSALAHAGTEEGEDSAAVFEAGRPELRVLETSEYRFFNENDIDLAQLDKALDRLARAAPPIKKRVVAAACAVIAHDGTVTPYEIELLRAACATLDVPMPPLAPSAK